jgi:hypothetical protein
LTSQFDEVAGAFGTPHDVESVQFGEFDIPRRFDERSKSGRARAANPIGVRMVLQHILLCFGKQKRIVLVVLLESSGVVHVTLSWLSPAYAGIYYGRT